MTDKCSGEQCIHTPPCNAQCTEPGCHETVVVTIPDSENPDIDIWVCLDHGSYWASKKVRGEATA